MTDELSPPAPAPTALAVSRLRVPEITAVFWLVKVLTTGIGETTSDFFVKAFDPIAVVLIASVLFAASFAVQIGAGRYVPWRYWQFVTMVAIYGTMAADVVHIVFDVPYLISTPAFALILALVFWGWWTSERTLSVHSIRSARSELLYWAAVLATFALGTALGDLTATVLGLGYLGSGLLFAVAFGAALVSGGLGMPVTFAFWSAYVLTRPLGASVADWLAVDRSRGGLGLGAGVVSVVGVVAIVLSVGILQLRRSGARNH